MYVVEWRREDVHRPTFVHRLTMGTIGSAVKIVQYKARVISLINAARATDEW